MGTVGTGRYSRCRRYSRYSTAEGTVGTAGRYLAAEESREAAPLWTLVLVATNILPEKMFNLATFFKSQLIAKRRDVSKQRLTLQLG